ncbi:MAG TPA: protein kinase [Acidimicrobiia bacterium]|nr:protein kinase [Acidimicrobiia bacterium]
MPPPVSGRFRLEVRIGRDGDLEEWLSTDTALDRPVLIRLLGPDSSGERRRQFLQAVQRASGVSHLHLAAIYMVEEVEGGAYSVSEWTGGATLQSRLDAGDTIEPEEFLPNAAGLASALAALHEAGVVHGGIDLSAITYTVAHPAKLGAFGRRSRGATTHDDVRSLAEALEEGLSGSPPGVSPPSELIDGLSPEVDRILRSGRRSAMGARGLAEAFASAPTPRRPQPESTRPSRRLLVAAALLAVAAAALVGLGRLFTPTGSPVAPPPATTGDGEVAASTTTTIPPTTTSTISVTEAVTASNPATFDPFGGGAENDELVAGLTDGDLSTSWRSEVYLDPLPLLKPGVGVTVEVSGTPRSLDLLGLTSGASLEIRWSGSGSEDLEEFETVGRLTSQPGATSLRLPPRTDGEWLVWFTDLPASEGDYMVAMSELRFRE